MFRLFKTLIVFISLYSIWVEPGSAFQLFGSNTSLQADTRTSLNKTLDSGPQMPVETPLQLGEDGSIDPGEHDSMNIWIPGLGVVGKMPKLDFGLEMLYGADKIQKDTPHAAEELKEFDSDFAIKGTIKRKF